MIPHPQIVAVLNHIECGAPHEIVTCAYHVILKSLFVSKCRLVLFLQLLFGDLFTMRDIFHSPGFQCSHLTHLNFVVVCTKN